jgi:PQQ-like domain
MTRGLDSEGNLVAPGQSERAMRFSGVAFLAVAFAACAAAPPSPPGEPTTPLALAPGDPVAVARAHTSAFATTLPVEVAGAKLVATVAGFGFFAARERLVAIDLRNGRERWARDGVSPETLAAAHHLVFVVTSRVTSTLALEAEDGRLVATLPNVVNPHVLDDVLYAERFGPASSAFIAYDAENGHELWRVFGAPGGSDAPHRIGTTLLQSFGESGAISVDAMHAFDVRTGREVWHRAWGPAPLGVGDGVVYLDHTWFPAQLDSYVPLTVATVAIGTGAVLHEFTYRPDPARNAPPGTRGRIDYRSQEAARCGSARARARWVSGSQSGPTARRGTRARTRRVRSAASTGRARSRFRMRSVTSSCSSEVTTARYGFSPPMRSAGSPSTVPSRASRCPSR